MTLLVLVAQPKSLCPWSLCQFASTTHVGMWTVLLSVRSRLKDAASYLNASGHEVTFLQACAGPDVQTKLTRLLLIQLYADDTADTSTTSETAAMKRGRFLVQQGRWRVFRPRTGKHT